MNKEVNEKNDYVLPCMYCMCFIICKNNYLKLYKQKGVIGLHIPRADCRRYLSKKCSLIKKYLDRGSSVNDVLNRRRIQFHQFFKGHPFYNE